MENVDTKRIAPVIVTYNVSNHLVNGTQGTANVHKLRDNPYYRWAYCQSTQSYVYRIFTSDEWCCSDPPANTAETGVRYNNTQMSRQVTVSTMLKVICFSVVIKNVMCTTYTLYACTHVCHPAPNLLSFLPLSLSLSSLSLSLSLSLLSPSCLHKNVIYGGVLFRINTTESCRAR